MSFNFANEPLTDTGYLKGQLFHWRNRDALVRFDDTIPVTNTVQKQMVATFGGEAEMEVWHPLGTFIDILTGKKYRIDLYELQMIIVPAIKDELVSHPTNKELDTLADSVIKEIDKRKNQNN